MGESACRLRVAAEMSASSVESSLVLDEASACVGTLHHLIPLLLKFYLLLLFDGEDPVVQRKTAAVCGP